MRALTVIPGQAGSAAVVDMPEPDPSEGDVLVDGLALGICGTDHEIVAGEYGWAPEGSERLILGHESLGRVREAPQGSGFVSGDLVVGVVRRPDPVPCAACASGEFDMCLNGRYTERGIKERHGYGSERWRVEPGYCVKLDPALAEVGMLLEPTTILAKAWDHIDRIGRRAGWWEVRRVLVTGAGPIGLLAALIAVQRDLEVHLLDRAPGGPKPRLARALGAEYHHEGIERAIGSCQPNVIIEATGVGQLVFDALRQTTPAGIICLTGVSPTGRRLTVDAGAINRELVLENDVVFGSVNANNRHYQAGAEVLVAADPAWLTALITRRVPLDRYAEALESHRDDVKVVLELGG
jgi:threonine dehydrogenase-like Zn-dependent dehydrogenase